MDAWWIIPAGFAIGAYGTLVGAGGGFVLMPVLLLLHPQADRAELAAVSLAVVFFNALSGSVAYGRMKRIDYRSGLLLSTAVVPGAVFGALVTGWVPKRLFDAILGAILVLGSVLLLVRRRPSSEQQERRHRFEVSRTLVDGQGVTHRWRYNAAVGLGLSVGVGFLSSLLGIGGGFIHVPVLIYVLNFPVHLATATSHFMLAIMSLVGTGVHAIRGTYTRWDLWRTLLWGAGVVGGAQLGALLSNRLRGRWVIRALVLALAFAGIRIFLGAIDG